MRIRHKKLVTALMIAIFILYSQTVSLYLLFADVHKQFIQVARRTSVRSTTQCVRPTLELWNDKLREIFVSPEPLSCSTVERNWVDVENGTLRISDAAVKRHGSVNCDYIPIHRGQNDFEVCTSGSMIFTVYMTAIKLIYKRFFLEPLSTVCCMLQSVLSSRCSLKLLCQHLGLSDNPADNPHRQVSYRKAHLTNILGS